MNADELQCVVEELIDNNGLVQVLNAIGDTCFLKEVHLLANWQDKLLAKRWAKNAIIIQQAKGKVFDLP